MLIVVEHVLIVFKHAYLHGHIGAALIGDSEDRTSYTYLHGDIGVTLRDDSEDHFTFTYAVKQVEH